MMPKTTKGEISIEDKLKPRQPVYKRVKMTMPHCPVCGLILSGNNSIALPWCCSCGEWEHTELGAFDYKIKVEQK